MRDLTDRLTQATMRVRAKMAETIPRAEMHNLNSCMQVHPRRCMTERSYASPDREAKLVATMSANARKADAANACGLSRYMS